MRAAAGTTGIMMAAVESMTGMTAAADMRGISKAAEGEGPPRGTKAPSKRKEGRIGVGLTFSWSICVTRIESPNARYFIVLKEQLPRILSSTSMPKQHQNIVKQNILVYFFIT